MPATLGLSKQAMEQIPNDLTRQSQKTYKNAAEPYGRYDHTSEMMEIDFDDGKEAIGTIRFKESENFAQLLQSFAETKENTIKIFEQRRVSINKLRSLISMPILYVTSLSIASSTHSKRPLLSLLFLFIRNKENKRNVSCF